MQAALPTSGPARRATRPGGPLGLLAAVLRRTRLPAAPDGAARPGGGRIRAVPRPARRPQRPRPDLETLYHAQRLDMVRLALFLVDDRATAEDVVQDAFVAVCRRHGTALEELDDAAAYLHTAVVNAARSVLRRRRTVRAHTPPHETSAGPVDEPLLLAEEHRQVLDAVRGLSRRQREVVVLRYWSGLTEAEIAETLGLSRGTVKSTASRALDALERTLGEDR